MPQSDKTRHRRVLLDASHDKALPRSRSKDPCRDSALIPESAGIFRKLYFYSIFFISSATNCTWVPTITCTEFLLGRITPATPADLIFFSSTLV